MLHWLHAYITSEPPAWINYSSPCHNTEDALIMTDSQTRQRSKWRGENTHDLHWVCNFIVWLLREHLQMRHVSPPALMGVCFLKKTALGIWSQHKPIVHKWSLSTWDHNELWSSQGRQWMADIFFCALLCSFSGMFHHSQASSRRVVLTDYRGLSKR